MAFFCKKPHNLFISNRETKIENEPQIVMKHVKTSRRFVWWKRVSGRDRRIQNEEEKRVSLRVCVWVGWGGLGGSWKCCSIRDFMTWWTCHLQMSVKVRANWIEPLSQSVVLGQTRRNLQGRKSRAADPWRPVSRRREEGGEGLKCWDGGWCLLTLRRHSAGKILRDVRQDSHKTCRGSWWWYRVRPPSSLVGAGAVFRDTRGQKKQDLPE